MQDAIFCYGTLKWHSPANIIYGTQVRSLVKEFGNSKLRRHNFDLDFRKENEYQTQLSVLRYGIGCEET
jgi:hypothetical protein